MRERIEADLKQAMRAGDTVTRDTLRLVLSDLGNARIAAGAELGEDEELAVLQSAVKSRRDSVEQYRAASRDDLAVKEEAEIEVISRYLPRMLDEAQTRAIVERTVAELGVTSKQDLGRVMKAVMAAHRGTVDGKLVQRLTAETLG